MKLNYINTPESEGGSAVPGCGTIHISELIPTLGLLSRELNVPFDLNNYRLASTGKREYSGDIDLVIDDTWFTDGSKAFYDKLIETFGCENVAINGGMIHLKYPIVNFDRVLQGSTPRTGFVQIDFSIGSPEWEMFFRFSAGDKSAYKGAQRNIAISSICGAITVDSEEKDSYDRPISTIRWKWSPKGFMRVNRTSIKDNRDGWRKKQNDEIIEGPYFDPDKIVTTLLPKDGVRSDLDSLETIIKAVKRNYDNEDQIRIWKRMSRNLFEWKGGKNFIYPTEISPYFHINDK